MVERGQLGSRSYIVRRSVIVITFNNQRATASQESVALLLSDYSLQPGGQKWQRREHFEGLDDTNR